MRKKKEKETGLPFETIRDGGGGRWTKNGFFLFLSLFIYFFLRARTEENDDDDRGQRWSR